MSKERELLQSVMEESWDFLYAGTHTEIKELLAQPEQTEQEPVAYLHEGIDETGETVRRIYCHFYEHANLIPLYTAPPKREPLSEDAVGEMLMGGFSTHLIDLVRMIEKAHGIGGGQ